jgi:MFS family permease
MLNGYSQAPAVGWSTPYEIALVIISVLLLAAFIHWEAKVAKCPIVPLDVWKAPSFLPLLGATLLSFMSFGTLLWYSVAWQQILRQWTPLQFAVGWTPFAISAPIGAFLGAWLVPRIPAQWILAIGATCVLISNLLLATMPVKQTYWAQMFPATMISAFCPDFVYVSAQIIASNSVSRSQQGVAASLIGTLNLYGNSLGLGFASTVESEVNRGEANPVKGYRAALYFGAGMAALALLVDVLFVRVKKDAREGWDEADGLEGFSVEGVSTAREPQSGRTLGRGLNPEPRVQDSVEALL